MKRTKNAMLATVTVMLFTTAGATGLALVRSGGEEGGGHSHDESGEAGHDESGEAGHDESGEAGHDESGEAAAGAEAEADEVTSAGAADAPLPTGLAPPAADADHGSAGHDAPSSMAPSSMAPSAEGHGHPARRRAPGGHGGGGH